MSNSEIILKELIINLKKMTENINAKCDVILNDIEATSVGIYLVKAYYGYSVTVNGFDLGLDVGYTEAVKIYNLLVKARKKNV